MREQAKLYLRIVGINEHSAITVRNEEFAQFYGRTYADSPDIDGRVWIASEEALVEGTFIRVCIDGLIDGDLSGYIVEEES